MIRNCEGYRDPTASEAIGRVMNDSTRKSKSRPRSECRSRRTAFVILQCGDYDPKQAQIAITAIFNYLVEKERIPVLNWPLYLADNINSTQDNQNNTLDLLLQCDEVWFFSMDGIISEAVKRQINEAKLSKKKIRYVKLER